MSNQILSVLEYMEKEKGISREDMIEAIAASIKNAALKGVNAGQELKVEINPKTGALKAWNIFKVVDSVGDPATEIHLEKANEVNPELSLGDNFLREMDPAYLGRIAAQTARQAIMQRIRQFEKDRLYDDFRDIVGDVVSGIVRRRERGNFIIDLGKAEALLPGNECIPGEEYAPGDRIRCLLLNIENVGRGPELVLSRSHIKFVRRLFELEVTELGDGTVSIESIAREPGYRTKVSVHSGDTKIDPVGACVGARGARVKAIVRELGGEKVDIIRYYEDPARMLQEAMKPAVPHEVEVDEEGHTISFKVMENDLSIAIGSKGRNARLTSKLMRWRLVIGKIEKQETGFNQRVQRAIKGLYSIQGITDDQAQRLVSAGITTPEAFEGVTPEDLVDTGFTEEEARHILDEVKNFTQSN